MKPEKGSWYPIQWVCTYGNPSMLSYYNAGKIHINKIEGEHVAIEKINTHQSKKVMVFY